MLSLMSPCGAGGLIKMRNSGAVKTTVILRLQYKYPVLMAGEQRLVILLQQAIFMGA